MTDLSPPGLIRAFRLSLRYDAPLAIATTSGERRFLRCIEGQAEGPELTASLADDGGDWLLLRQDGLIDVEGRMMLQSASGQCVYWRSRGVLRPSGAGLGGSLALQPWFDAGAGAHVGLTETVFLATGSFAETPDGARAELDIWRPL